VFDITGTFVTSFRAERATLAKDKSGSSRLGEELEAAVASGVRSVDVDLRQVSFCDCSGLNGLLDACAHARTKGVSFGISGPVAPIVERLFQVTGVEGVLPVRSTA
jgi:anti-anti-sigma factor